MFQQTIQLGCWAGNENNEMNQPQLRVMKMIFERLYFRGETSHHNGNNLARI